MENKRETGDHLRAMVKAAPTTGRTKVFSENSARRLKAWLWVMCGFVLSCGALHFTPNITKSITHNGIGLVMLDGSRRKVCPRMGKGPSGKGQQSWGWKRMWKIIYSDYVYIYIYSCVYIHTWGFPDGSVVKNLPANAGDPGSIPGAGRSPGEGNGSSLQYSCLENPMDRGAWKVIVHAVTKSQTQLSD